MELDLENISQQLKWDRFVENHACGWLCHLTDWKKALENQFSHIRGRIIVICNGDRIEAGIPLYEVRSLYAGKRLVSIPFATLNDPLNSNLTHLRSLLDCAIDLGKETGCHYVEVKTQNTAPMMQELGLRPCSIYKHHYISLAPDIGSLLKSFDRSCVRQRISRSAASGISLKIAKNDEDFADFYSLYMRTRKRVGLPPLPMQYLRHLAHTFGEKKRAKILLAIHEGKAIAGLFLLKFKNRVSAEILGTDEQYLKISPNHFIFWEAIKEAHQEGYEVFDFGRTDPSNRSLMDFKARWGTQVVDLSTFYLPVRKTIVSKTNYDAYPYRIMKKAIQHMPPRILAKFGEFIYKHRA
ncbi:MAG: GNAT family N-acetyltransferase [Acidobacteria bacterium]|nr:GNAT family N-acetyltransferase [Acidobacteriota bacterium]